MGTLEPRSKKGTRRRSPWSLGCLVAAIFVPLFIFGGWRWLLGYVPPFYRERWPNPQLETRDLTDELEARLLNLRNSARAKGRWEGRFSEVSINRWLAVDLPKKFAGELPAGWLHPRIDLFDGGGAIGIQWSNFWGSGVVTLRLRTEWDAADGCIRLHGDSLSWGAFPIPIGLVQGIMGIAIQRQKLVHRWVDDDQGPVCLIFPSDDLLPNQSGVTRLIDWRVEQETLIMVWETKDR